MLTIYGFVIGLGLLALMIFSAEAGYKADKIIMMFTATILWPVSVVLIVMYGLVLMAKEVGNRVGGNNTRSTLSRKQRRTIEFNRQQMEIESQRLQTQREYEKLIFPAS